MVVSVCAVLLLSFVTALRAERITVTSTKEGCLFTQECATKILFYQRRPKSLNGKFERANYIHPLYDLDGQVLTEDFPVDHPHHRGIFWAWHQVRVDGKLAGDSWIGRDFSWDVQRVDVIQDDGQSAAIDVLVIWKSRLVTDGTGQPIPLVKEMTTVRVCRKEWGTRKIDFVIRLVALQPKVRIGGSENEKGYGGFSTRIRLPENIRFAGESGDLTPQTVAVEGGAWIDMTACFGENRSISGLSILSHPSLPGFPQPWILRRSGSMQNPVFPGRESVALSMTDPLVLRYRLIVHRGETDGDKIRRWQKAYAEQKVSNALRTGLPQFNIAHRERK